MINSNVTTITLDGAETAIEFEGGYPYYQITNKSDTDFYISLSPNITPETEGVYTVSAGGWEIIGSGYPFKKFYILGTGKAYILGKQNAMLSSFKRGGKGGGGNAKAKPLVIFEGLEDGYNFADGITGFETLNDTPSGGGFVVKENNKDPSFWGGTTNIELSKSFSLYANETISKNIDSALFALDKEIDVTNYNYILVDCFYYSDYSTSAFIANMGGAYFRMGEPDNLPQSNVAYDWDNNGWKSMNIEYNLAHTMFFDDISDINGLQKICFGVLHGTYRNSYTNICRIHKIILA